MGIFGSSDNGPTKLNSIKITQSAQGLPLPVVMGRGRVQQSLLWQNGFSIETVSAGKGGGKGAGFLYSADTICGLCEGPVLSINDVWYNNTWLSNSTGSENTTVATAGIYTPQGASTFTSDSGVSIVNTYSQTAQSAGAPSGTTLSGSDLAPMQNVPYGTTLSQGQYSFNPESIGTFNLTAVANASGGNTVYTGSITGGAANAFVGYMFIIQGFTHGVNNSGSNDATTGYICVASTATTLTLANPSGTAESHAATAQEPGNTYHFSAVDAAAATPIVLGYTFRLQYIRAQEIDVIPTGLSLNIGQPYYYGVDMGVSYYGEDNPLNGIALISVATNPPTVTGTYHFISSGKSTNGNTYKFAPGDLHQEVLATYQYQNLAAGGNNAQGNSKDIPTTLNFTLFNGVQGQAPWSLLTDTFPGEALGYTSTAFAGFNPMELGESANVPNITYEIQTADQYGGGIVDCNPIQCITQVLTNPVWGLGAGAQPFPLQCIDNGPYGTWGFATGTPNLASTPNTVTTGPVTVKAYSSTGAGWPGLGGTLLSTTTVNTPVFNQVIPNYPITGFQKQPGAPDGGGYKLTPMVAVETTSNGSLLDTKVIGGTTNTTFILDMTGVFTIPAPGTYTFFVNYANFSSWAFYIQSATLVSGGVTPPASNTISQGGGHTPFPTTGPTTSFTKVGEQSNTGGAHPTPSTIYVSFTAAGTYGYEACYTQSLQVNGDSGQANSYFQITAANGKNPVKPTGGVGTVGAVILPTVLPGQRVTGTTAFNWFAANGYFISPVLDKQDSASSTMSKWMEAGMCANFYSEGLLKLVPYGDTSTAGNGVTWLAPADYVVSLDDTCFIAKDGEEPVRISRTAWQDGFNSVQVKWTNRQNQYSPEVTPEFIQAAINRFGLRLEDPIDFGFITTLVAATFTANMRVKRMVNIRNNYQFDLPYTYSYLEPMDLVLITTSSSWATSGLSNANLGVVNLPVRITKVVDDPTAGLQITAEDYPYGVGMPVLFNKATNASTPVADLYALPGDSEIVAFEAYSRLTMQQGNQIWIGATGASNNWGGCDIYVSQDNESYLQIGTIKSRARMGELAANFSTGSDPDMDNELIVDMAVNSPPLEAGADSDADAGNTLCFVDGEIVSYSTCTVTSNGQFTMNLGAPSVAGYIRRGLMGSSIAAHMAGSLFLRLDNTIFKYTYDPTWYGKTIYFKFLSFNQFQNSTQGLEDVDAVPFTVPGVNGGPVDVSSGLVLVQQPPLIKPAPPIIGVGRLGWNELIQGATMLMNTSPTSPYFTARGCTITYDSSTAQGSNFSTESGTKFSGFGGAQVVNIASPVTNPGVGAITYTAVLTPGYNVIGGGLSLLFGMADGTVWAGADSYCGFQMTKPGNGAMGNWILRSHANGSGVYNQDSGVVSVNGASTTLSFTINAAGTLVTFSINGVVVGTSTDVPTIPLGLMFLYQSGSFSGNGECAVTSLTLEY